VRSEPGAPAVAALSFRLYVAAASPNTRRALENLRAVCTTAGQTTYDLKIIDVLHEPQRALQDGITVAPTLVKVAPGPLRTIIGDLSDRDAVLAALELSPAGGRG